MNRPGQTICIKVLQTTAIIMFRATVRNVNVYHFRDGNEFDRAARRFVPMSSFTFAPSQLYEIRGHGDLCLERKRDSICLSER